MAIAFTGLSAVIPSILLVWFFKSRDVHPEPSRVLWITFWLGVLSIVPTLVVAIPVMAVIEGNLGHPLAQGMADAFLTAALPEELFKLGVLYVYVVKQDAFDEPMDGIVYGVVASLGFATLENILYTLDGGLSVAIMRAFTAVPMHAACGAIMGYYVGQSRFNQGSAGKGAAVKGYIFAVLIHGLYDAPLMWMEAAGAGSVVGIVWALGVLIFGVVWAVVLVRRLRKEQLELLAQGRFVLAQDPSISLTAAALEPPSPKSNSSALLGWVLIVAGFVLAAAGGLFLLGGALALVMGAVPGPELQGFLVGCAILSLPPLGIGISLFVVGLRKLPKKQLRRRTYDSLLT